MDFAVLATGPSMSQEVADFVRGKCGVVAVNDAYRLAPWADALVCNDAAWWNVHKDAYEFKGRKFCGVTRKGLEYIPATPRFPAGTNSGLQGCRVAEMLGATRILLLGFDMHGTHYFGPHPAPLRNTPPHRFKAFLQQFANWKGVPIINCTPGSALTHFPMSTIEAELDGGRSNLRAQRA